MAWSLCRLSPGRTRGGARGRTVCPGRHISGPNLRSEWVRADAFGQLCLFGSPRWAVYSVRVDARWSFALNR
jgi:hypothetical protein